MGVSLYAFWRGLAHGSCGKENVKLGLGGMQYSLRINVRAADGDRGSIARLTIAINSIMGRCLFWRRGTRLRWVGIWVLMFRFLVFFFLEWFGVESEFRVRLGEVLLLRRTLLLTSLLTPQGGAQVNDVRRYAVI